MIDAQDKIFIEKRLNERIDAVRLVAETRPSFIFLLKGKRQYIFKLTKKIPLNRQFKSHKRIFDLWSAQKKALDFRIPEPHLLGPDGRFVLMEYIDGENLLKKLFAGRDQADSLFRRAGRSLKQYHSLMTQAINDEVKDLSQCEYMADILLKTDGHIIRERLNEFPSECERVLFKDFTPANIVVSHTNEIYFLDMQDTFYSGPFYYDLSRFIDTTKVFSIIKNPLRAIGGYHRTLQAVDAFLAGYGDDIDIALLKKMQSIHRKEHIHIKMAAAPVRAVILKILYMVV